MSQPPSTYSKLANASARLAHRRIFPQPPAPPSHGNDLHRIAAKIRELQDDVRAILGENSQVEEENCELIRILEQLEYVVGEQQCRLDELTRCLLKDVEADDCIAQYEQDLVTVALQINTLNELIRTKNQQYEVLRAEKEEELYQNMRLKEQSNLLLFSHNAIHQELDLILVEEQEQQELHTFNDDLERKAQLVFAYCQRLAAQAEELRDSIDKSRRESNQRMNAEREKRIRLEYEVKLLLERKTDQNKKQGYFKGFYDEQRIQEVIDDMLQKEDALRSQIAEQEEATRIATQEWEETLEDRRRQVARMRLQRQEEAKLLQLEMESMNRQLQESTTQYMQVSHRLEVSESEGIQMNQFQENLDGQLWQRIKTTEEENLKLQRQFQQLTNQVLFIQRQLTL